jgi:hypothetical protein
VKNKTTSFSIPHQFSNSKTAAPTNCNPFYFIPISEKAHKLCPTLISSVDYKISSTKRKTSRIYQDLDIARIPTPYCFDRHPSPFTFSLKRLNFILTFQQHKQRLQLPIYKNRPHQLL